MKLRLLESFERQLQPEELAMMVGLMCIIWTSEDETNPSVKLCTNRLHTVLGLRFTHQCFYKRLVQYLKLAITETCEDGIGRALNCWLLDLGSGGLDTTSSLFEYFIRRLDGREHDEALLTDDEGALSETNEDK